MMQATLNIRRIRDGLLRVAGSRGKSLRFLAVGLSALVLGACGSTPEKEAVVLVYPPPPDQPRFYYERTLTGSSDVSEETASDRFRRFATGETLRGQGFSKPFGLVASNGRIYVGDSVARRISALDLRGGRYFEFGDRGMGRLTKPLGMDVDDAGRIYVCDGTSRRVLIYDADGNFLNAVGSDETLDRPSGVAVNREGTRIYVVDTGGVKSESHRVRVFAPDGTHLQDIGSRGKGEGQFNLPLDAAVSPDGRLYVLDTGNFRVQVFSPDGRFLFTFGQAGRTPGHFSHPKSIDVDREGKVFVADTAFGNIQIFNAEGQILMFMGDRSDRGGPGEFILPAGIAVDVDGRIYVIDQFFRKIEVFRPAGLPAETPPGGPAEG